MAIDDISAADPAAAQLAAASAGQEAPVPEQQQGAAVAAPAVAPHLAQFKQLIEQIDKPNLAPDLPEDELGVIGQRVLREYRIDEASRSDWLDKNKVAMDLAMQIAKAKTYPWPNASNVIYPLITTAAIEFASRAGPEIIRGRDVLKGVVVGSDDGVPALHPEDGTPLMRQTPAGFEPVWQVLPGAKMARAARIGEHMSWQLLEEQSEWEPETDQLLHILPIVGCHFRKTYFDPTLGRNMSCGVTAQNLVVNYWAKSLEIATRITEEVKLYPLQILENERSDTFLEHEYGTAPGANGDEDAPHEFLEQHRWLDLDDDGFPEPYIVTVHKLTGKVVRIYARYDADGVMISRRKGKISKISPVHYYTQYNFLPNPDGGIYGIGFGQLLKPINESVNTTLNMLIDAGHLQNVGGGFLGKGLSMHAGSVRFKAGEWKVLNVPGSAIRDAIVPLPTPGPSTQLIALLTMLIDAGEKIASSNDVLSGQSSLATMQPTTLMALIEQGLKVYKGIYKRIYRSMAGEGDKLYRLNSIYLEEQASYRRGDEWRSVTREDYRKGSGVEPVADPDMVSDMQRMVQAQLLEGYKDDPMCDGMEIRRRVFQAARVADADKLLVKNPPPNPMLLLAERENMRADIKTKAAAIKDLAGAAKDLAMADKALGELRLQWVAQNFDMLTARIEALDEPADQSTAPDAAGAGGGGDSQAGLPALAPSPGDAAVPPVSGR